MALVAGERGPLVIHWLAPGDGINNGARGGDPGVQDVLAIAVKRGIIKWKDETKNVTLKKRRRKPTVSFTPELELVIGAMFVSSHVLERVDNGLWPMPILSPRRKHRKKQTTVLIYAGTVKLNERRPDGREVRHVKHTFIMEGGRYIINALAYLSPTADR